MTFKDDKTCYKCNKVFDDKVFKDSMSSMCERIVGTNDVGFFCFECNKKYGADTQNKD